MSDPKEFIEKKLLPRIRRSQNKDLEKFILDNRKSWDIEASNKNWIAFKNFMSFIQGIIAFGFAIYITLNLLDNFANFNDFIQKLFSF